MEYVIIAVAAFLASTLTFFSGFGLNTLLMPVLALFFPLQIAIGLTAVVHILNNTFKLGIIGKFSQWRIVLNFGVPALVTSFVGAYVLVYASGIKPLFRYSLTGQTFEITWIKLITGFLILIFTYLESLPFLRNMTVSPKWMTIGGLLSGFFGGLSGHQGALRSVFLVRLTLEKQAYIATGTAIAFMIDIARLFVYSNNMLSYDLLKKYLLILAIAVLSALLGVIVGNTFLKKITYRLIQQIVTIFLSIVGLALIAGLL
ncbi:MAG: sulfite exporter TauE/SafE family protein [Bacteroidia bacterium]|nr:sulfite exporter TauE/SafE family protein [Bacteroidia bacterium]MDW8301459.1 sulfite exporter TauE/SafE family protein [Bacteroidia bacterium]